MLNTLANHNDDIKRLLEKGYAVSIDSDHLVVRDIPYLDSEKKLHIGAIVSILIFVDQEHVKQHNHQIYFCGSHPCQLDGGLILNLGNVDSTLSLASTDIVVQRSFSNKPPNGFVDFFEKIESYVTIISGPAMSIYNVSPLTYRAYDDISNSVFKIHDTLTSRAVIGDLAKKFENDIVAIIGLGGTGSYLLDFLVKTPVKEIRAFDIDRYFVHNAFRSPGKLDTNELGKTKAEIYQNRYENFRTGINMQPKYILADSDDDLTGVTFAFICVDKGLSRTGIFELLIRMNIPFIDVGMGLDRDKGPISGTIRSTYFATESTKEVLTKKLSPLSDLPDEEYRNNIQISELNALNACLAVIKYKQLRGFYADDNSYYHMLFTIDSLNCVGE